VNAAKFERHAVRIAAELEEKLHGLNDDDREALGAIIGSVGRVYTFLGAVKSPALKDAGKSVEKLLMLLASLQAPLVGVGDQAGAVVDAAMPAVAGAAPTVAAILRTVLGAGA